MPEASKNNLKGQALFLRGLAYFELARYFNRAPLQLTPVADRSASAQPLATGEQLYAQVIKDVQEAVTLLPKKSAQEAGRATSGSAGALLANVYMIQKKWAEAEAVLKTIVTSNEYSLIPDYANVFSTTAGNKNNSESVFEVQYLEGSQGLNGSFLYAYASFANGPQ